MTLTARQLYPNFGAEEADRPPRSVPGLDALAALWESLFDDEERDAAFSWLAGARGLVAWLPTPRARAAAAARALPLFGPAPEVVRQLSDKAWAHELSHRYGLVPAPLQPLIEVLAPATLNQDDTAAALAARIAGWPSWTGGNFTLKPRLGSSGRGRVGSATGGIEASALRRLATRGGALLEPWLSRSVDLSVQLYISLRGEVELLGTTTQLLRASGGYLGNEGVLDEAGEPRSGTPYDERLIDAARLIGKAAAQAGFWGPCGIDAFVFWGPDGQAVLRPVVELNARFTTGTLALGLLRRAQRAGRIEPGARWRFHLTAPPHQSAPLVDALPGGAVLLLGEAAGDDGG